MLQDGGALPEEECDVIGAYTAMLKKKFSWQLVEEGWRGQERKKNGRRKRN